VFGKLHFFPHHADPCLFVRNGDVDIPPAFIILYVDDGVIIATDEVIEEVMQALAKEFSIKDLGQIKDFVGCRIHEDKDHSTIWIHQPKLLHHLETTWRKDIKTEKVYKTPAAPRAVVMRPEKGDPLISTMDQSRYRSGVGMLLYLVKHSRPDISNSVRELTKVLDGATQAHWKAMVRVIKYVLDTKMYALKLQPREGKLPGISYLEGFSDSEFAGGRDTR